MGDSSFYNVFKMASAYGNFESKDAYKPESKLIYYFNIFMNPNFGGERTGNKFIKRGDSIAVLHRDWFPAPELLLALCLQRGNSENHHP